MDTSDNSGFRYSCHDGHEDKKWGKYLFGGFYENHFAKISIDINFQFTGYVQNNKLKI